MEKIRASEILKLKPEITLEELNKFKFFGIDPFNKKVLLFTHYPYSKPSRPSPLGLESWENPISIAVCGLYDRELGKSLREIDFLVDTSSCKIINNIKSELQGGFHSEIKSKDLIVNQDEVFMPARIDPHNYKNYPVRNLIVDKDVIGDSDVIYKNDDGSLTTTKPGPARIFKEGDIAHIMYRKFDIFPNFGISMPVKVIELKTGLVKVKFQNEKTLIIEERFLSFSPFSYEYGGFTQVRPNPEPKVGDYGFFYDEENPAFFCYGELSNIYDIKEGNYPYESKGALGLFYRYKYFSAEVPELAKDVPVPKFN